MDFARQKRMLYFWIDKIGNVIFRLLWHLVHAIVYLCYFTMAMVHGIESHLISRGLLRKYKYLHISKINYLAIVIESEEACRTSNVIQLLQWVVALGINHICLYDNEGILKKSKDVILNEFDGAILFEDTHENNMLLDQPCMTLEFVSFSDGKEAVARAANVLLMKYIKSGAAGSNQGEQIFSESEMSEALKTVGSGGPEPDLLLIYGPARCHLGFPAWRIRYTEIQHMGPLKSMTYGSLVKALYRYTTVRQNYGK